MNGHLPLNQQEDLIKRTHLNWFLSRLYENSINVIVSGVIPLFIVSPFSFNFFISIYVQPSTHCKFDRDFAVCIVLRPFMPDSPEEATFVSTVHKYCNISLKYSHFQEPFNFDEQFHLHSFFFS